ncbi:methyltransferase [bacterium]|nr:methyltransferase [candidate division CSSED10-310 bacterium]
MSIIGIHLPTVEEPILFEQRGLPVSQEALFLLKFLVQARVSPDHAAADLGCGSGLLTVGLARLFPSIRVYGVELQPELVSVAEDNARRNGLMSRIAIIQGDIRQPESRPPDNACDLVVMNPPFRRTASGKLSPDVLRRHANHEMAGTLEDFIRVASICLSHHGRMAMVMVPERLPDTLQMMTERHVPAAVIQWIHHTPQLPANAVLILGCKGGRGGLTVLPPFFCAGTVA